jgi:hypothetical protein
MNSIRRGRALVTRWLPLVAGFALAPVWAQSPLSVNDYGGAGLWQTPTARYGGDGDFSLGVSSGAPYNRLFVTLVPLPGVETTLRYTDITNRLYSDVPEFSGDQSFKDRSFDARVRLWRESDRLPELAIGLRDVGGSSLFASQYLVASRRHYSFDWSLGVGWGRMAGSGALPNPFDGLTGQAEDVPRAGSIGIKGYFGGPRLGLFGGVVWQTPVSGLEAVAEYDANDFSKEPKDNNQVVRWPVNVGLRYRLPFGIQLGLSYQRGDILAFQLALQSNFVSSPGFPKLFDPPPPPPHRPLIASAASAVEAANPEKLGREVQSALQRQRIALTGFAVDPEQRRADLWLGSQPYNEPLKAVGRAARAASTVLPDSVSELRLTGKVAGAEIYQVSVHRPSLDRTAMGAMSEDEFRRTLTVSSPELDKPAPQFPSRLDFPAFRGGFSPQLRSSVGGPDGFYFGQIWLRAAAGVSLTERWSLSAQLGANVYNNFDQIKLQSDSVLPHVRSDIVRYLQEGEQSLVRLESDYIRQLGSNWYGRFSAGIFEEMYGGVAGELLYRPDDPRWAVGMNLNRVRQRDFDQRLRFRDYEITTGHLTGYFQLPRPNLLLKLSLGQYLAGDRGGTVELSRRFANGLRAGVFVTKTNVSADQFGEGSFDKGFYFVIPFDLFQPRSTRASGSFVFRPLTRDGGQMVRDGPALYDLTYDAVQLRIPERPSLFFE